MTKEQLAQVLNRREIGNEITREEEKLAKSSGLVVIFGASDDLCELRGAINEEFSSYKECSIFIRNDGKLLHEIEDDDIEVLDKYEVLGVVQQMHQKAAVVKSLWCATPEYSWTYETKIPHAAFDVLEGEEKYCRGIVIDLHEIA